MRVAVFSAKSYDRQFLEAANAEHGHELRFFEPRLSTETAPLAGGFDAVCVFVNDVLKRATLVILREGGTRLIALRCSGFNNVDLEAADELDMKVVRVPAYSPHAVAEHTLALILGLNRRITRASARVHEGNFSLEGLLGFDLHGRTVGVVGTGRIGQVVVQILRGFGCRLLGHDVTESDACMRLGLEYVPLEQLFRESDIVTLHCPLTPETYRIINADALMQMQRGTMLINTSRGALVDTRAVIDALKTGRLGYLGIDVYEEEADLFFEDLSDQVLQDDVFARLLTFPNVLITGHQAFFTEDALRNIASTTLHNITCEERGQPGSHRVSPSLVKA
ncbi:MAG: 2-hydroxyacid dehydrogenase [Phycisphaerales bacterium]|nr:MAG: 2-hydroxyacid dehydrogenase [Phycisphaerales bacterium]